MEGGWQEKTDKRDRSKDGEKEGGAREGTSPSSDCFV